MEGLRKKKKKRAKLHGHGQQHGEGQVKGDGGSERGYRGRNADGERLDLGWITQNTVYR